MQEQSLIHWANVVEKIIKLFFCLFAKVHYFLFIVDTQVTASMDTKIHTTIWHRKRALMLAEGSGSKHCCECQKYCKTLHLMPLCQQKAGPSSKTEQSSTSEQPHPVPYNLRTKQSSGILQPLPKVSIWQDLWMLWERGWITLPSLAFLQRWTSCWWKQQRL